MIEMQLPPGRLRLRGHARGLPRSRATGRCPPLQCPCPDRPPCAPDLRLAVRIGGERVAPGALNGRSAGRLAASISCMVADEGSDHSQDLDAAAAPIDRANLRCSFCGKVYAEVETMVCGPTPSVAICDECVERCTEIMAEQRGGPTQAA
jgi:ClpX C4-type zinc finger